MNEHPRIPIVFIVNDFLFGGAQRLYLNLFDTFDRSEFDVHLVTLLEFPGKRYLYAEVPEHVSVHRFCFGSFKDIRKWWALARTLRRLHPQVVVSSLFFSNTVVRMLQPFFGYRVIAIEHNTYIAKTRAQILVDRVLSHCTYAIVAVSQTVLSFTTKQESIPEKKFRLIRNGVNLSKIENQLRTVDTIALRHQLKLAESDKVVLNVGRLTEQKNQGTLIEAFVTFSRSHPEYKLFILGEGKLKGEYERLTTKLHAENSVRLLGVKDDIISFYALADFLVSASYIEGLSMTQAEALAAGLPLLSTKTAGADEMIDEGKNGYFIKQPTADSICAGLEMMAVADLARMCTFARASAARYDIQETARRYVQLIRECLRTG